MTVEKKTLRAQAIESCEFSESELKMVEQWVSKDRFANGRNALQKWIQIGGIANRIKASNAFNRTTWVKAFEECIGYELPKAERAAAMSINDHDHGKISAWYLDSESFAVSPRTILKNYGSFLTGPVEPEEEETDGETEEKETGSTKSPFVVVTEALTKARKAIEDGIDDMTAKDLEQLESMLDGLRILVK